MIIPVILIAALYFGLGRKLKKNGFAWIFVGLGVLITVQLIGVPFLSFFKTPDQGIVFWTLIHIASYIIAITIALIIAFRNKLIKL